LEALKPWRHPSRLISTTRHASASTFWSLIRQPAIPNGKYLQLAYLTR